MVFTSLIFTYIFLPTVLILYYGTRGKYRNYVLLLTSLIFYAYGEYSGAAEPLFRKSGNRLSGIGNRRIA